MACNRCSMCGQEALTERLAPFTVENGAKSRVIQDRQTVCSSCGNVSYQGSQISDHELAVAAAVREMEGLLSAEDLRRVRSKYRFRQTDLEQMFSVGPKTWTRWERGKVPQSKAADTLIRIISEDPDVARRLMLQAGVENAEAEAMFLQIEADAKRLARAAFRRELGEIGNSSADSIADQMADKAFDTVRDVRRIAAERAEAA